MDIILLLGLIIHRLVAGIQNGHGYGHNSIGRKEAGWGLLAGAFFCTVPLILHKQAMPSWMFITGFIFAGLSATATLMIELIFQKKIPKPLDDIHFWEIFKTGGVVLTIIAAGFNLIIIACSVYPGLILHKGMVNVNSGHKFFYQGTDDETGKTFKIPLLNITIPRTSTTVRIILAVVSLALAVITSINGWDLALYKH